MRTSLKISIGCFSARALYARVIESGRATPLLRGGRDIKKKMRSHRSGADGVVRIAEVFRNAFFLIRTGPIPDHPVRSIKGGFATSS
jgi:hypothetical protein